MGTEEAEGLMLRTAGTVVILLGLWLLLSGIYTPLIVGLGVVSVLVVVYVSKRMDSVDGDRVEIRLKPAAFAGYIVWLFGEIAKANWAVTKIILSPEMPIRQHFFAVRHSQQTDLGQVIFANSITLTPGTISVETEPGSFLVHAVAYSPSDDGALAEMDRRVSATENVSFA